MTRGFDYQKTDRSDCFTCYQNICDCARGHICGYDEKPIQRGYRCGLYIVNSKPTEIDTVKQNELF